MEDGAWIVSDYGLAGLQSAYGLIFDANSPEDRLLAVDRAFNVVHQRGDLSAFFIEGGSTSLTAIANATADTMAPPVCHTGCGEAGRRAPHAPLGG